MIIRHHLEERERRDSALFLLAKAWLDSGHAIFLALGCENLPPADLAILHVDLSVVPDAYSAAARAYPRSVNAGATDIRKSRYSSLILSEGDDWKGPVIVKTDLNCGGVPEWVAWRRASQAGLDAGEEPKRWTKYKIFRDLGSVPSELREHDGLIVERFTPEFDGTHFYLRTWIFFGAAERCRRFRSPNAIVKGADYSKVEEVPVPEELRTERERLGLDYGKMDFVIHKGRPVLLDANKTPGRPPADKPHLREAYAGLATGIDAMLRQ